MRTFRSDTIVQFQGTVGSMFRNVGIPSTQVRHRNTRTAFSTDLHVTWSYTVRFKHTHTHTHTQVLLWAALREHTGCTWTLQSSPAIRPAASPAVHSVSQTSALQHCLVSRANGRNLDIRKIMLTYRAAGLRYMATRLHGNIATFTTVNHFFIS